MNTGLWVLVAVIILGPLLIAALWLVTRPRTPEQRKLAAADRLFRARAELRHHNKYGVIFSPSYEKRWQEKHEKLEAKVERLERELPELRAERIARLERELGVGE